MDHQTFAQLLGNYGEFVGAIAVVVTLAYVAIQVRHTRQVVEENARSARYQIVTELLAGNAAPDSIVSIAYDKTGAVEGRSNAFANRLVDEFSFTMREAIRYGNWCFLWMKRQEMAFFQPVDETERTMQRSAIRSWISQNNVQRDFWLRDETRGYFDPRFRDFVDELLGTTA